MKKFVILIAAILGGCTAGPTTQQNAKASAVFSQASTASLCYTNSLGTTPALSKLMIEAELASRGAKHCANESYGRTSASMLGAQRYSRSSANTVSANLDKDCGDFPSGASAQRYFLASGGPHNDPHDLDRDGDGLACEWGVEAQRLASYTYKAPRTTYRAPRRARASQRCYTGPRGGTYTITASGNKNYDGC